MSSRGPAVGGMCFEAFVQAEQLLLSAEQHIALLDAFSPLNFDGEKSRIEALLAQGAVSLPRFEYRREQPQALELASRQIASARELLRGTGTQQLLAVLLGERAHELEVEGRLVAARGTEQVPLLSRERYIFTTAEMQRAGDLAEIWLEEALSVPSSRGAKSEPQVKLASALVEMCRQAGHSFRILEREMASIAAVGGDCLYVQTGARVASHEALRIWEHEVGAHLLPRLNAQQAGPPFRIGSAASNEDEEGRAILLEQRAGLLACERKLGLALRFLLARAARRSLSHASSEAVRLVQRGAAAESVAEALCRVSRGGGLARGVSYLASFLRVKESLEQHPDVETYLRQGRVSISAALRLQQARSFGL